MKYFPPLIKRLIKQFFWLHSFCLASLNKIVIAKENKRAKKLYQLYREAILCCIHNRVQKWWNFLPDTKFDSEQILDTFLLDAVLHRAGDYKEYLRIKDKLRQLFPAKEEDCFHKLARYYSKAIKEMDSGLWTKNLHLDSAKRPFLIAFSVWGEHYLTMLLDYCLPSLLADGNLKSLCQVRQPLLFIHTDTEGKKRIENSVIIQKIKTMGVIVLYRLIDTTLIACFDEDGRFRYWHLGMVQSLDLFFAKTLDADYHILLPDTVYSANHFQGILQAISRGPKVVSYRLIE